MEFILGDGLSKARSLSDQPASCPLCGAILRQSRNLRRHLELLHFGLGNSGKSSSIHARHRRVTTDRANDFGLPSLACVRPTARIDSHLAARSSEVSDFPMMTPLSIASSVSSASSVSLPGEPLINYSSRNARCWNTFSFIACMLLVYIAIKSDSYFYWNETYMWDLYTRNFNPLKFYILFLYLNFAFVKYNMHIYHNSYLHLSWIKFRNWIPFLR